MSEPEPPPAPGWGTRREYPLTGERIGPAWRYAWRLLWRSGDQFLAGARLKPAVAANHHVAEKTVDGLLRGAVTAGILESKLTNGSRPRRLYRVSRQWLAENTTTEK